MQIPSSVYKGMVSVVLAAVLVANVHWQAQATAQSDADYNLGLAAYNKKQYDEAATLLWKSITEGNRGPDPWLLMGNAYLSEGNTYEAAKAYQSTSTIFKDTPAGKAAAEYLRRLGPNALRQPPPSRTAPTAVSRVPAAPAPVSAAPATGKSFKDRIDIIKAIDGHPPVSKETINTARSAVQHLPPSIYKILDEGGAVLHVAPNLVDKWPEARLQPLADGSNLSTQIGRTYGRDMYACQQIIEPSTNAVRETNTQAVIEATVFNEIGHALDDILKISSAPDVKHAYEQDVDNLHDDVKSRFWLYLQDPPGGCMETCAEIVDQLLGGKGYNTQMMRSNFPLTYELVKKRLKL